MSEYMPGVPRSIKPEEIEFKRVIPEEADIAKRNVNNIADEINSLLASFSAMVAALRTDNTALIRENAALRGAYDAHKKKIEFLEEKIKRQAEGLETVMNRNAILEAQIKTEQERQSLSYRIKKFLKEN